MPTRKSEATWKGTLREGAGTMKLGSGAYEGEYTYASRFQDAKGTNPEELIGAAHAGCFSMFLSSLLTKAEFPPTSVHTEATVHLNDGAITKIDLVSKAVVSGIDAGKFAELAAEAKANCPVSKALAAVSEINLDAKLAK